MLISENYANRLEGFSKIPLESRAQYVQRFIDAQLDGERLKAKSIDVRNTVLQDFYHLLLGQWDKSTSLQSRFTDISNIDPDALNSIRSQLTQPQVIDHLQQRLHDAKSDTAASFAAFIEKARTVTFEGEGEFLRWYYNSLPYLVVDINKADLRYNSPQQQQKFAIIYQRINDMLDLYTDISTERLKLDESAMAYVYRWREQP